MKLTEVNMKFDHHQKIQNKSPECYEPKTFLYEKGMGTSQSISRLPCFRSPPIR